ncbi:MAG: plastocyanin/azurin family copper-binding protein [Acidimicrobiales bacterium]
MPQRLPHRRANRRRTLLSFVAMLVLFSLIGAACGPDDLPPPGTADNVVGAPSDSVATVSTGRPSGELESILPDLTPVADLPAAPADEAHTSYLPNVPPPIARSDQRVVEVHLEVTEALCPIDPASGTSTLSWGFRVAGDTDHECGAPGPVVRARVGDLLRFTLTNPADSQHPHNIDFHAVTGQGGGAAALTIPPGESASIEARLLYPGAFMYHCAFGDVPEHIARGMYGMIIVDPEEPLPEVDHEWAITQSEWYLGETDATGEAPFDREALTLEEPRFVTFNGRTDALTGDNALTMAVGERARIYMVNEGLNLNSNFHPIGSHWDAVYPEGATHPVNHVIRGSQSTLVVAGGATVVEVLGLVPSTIILVDHALVRTFYKGAIGQLVVTGDENPEIFAEGVSDAGTAPPPSDSGADGGGESATAGDGGEDGDVEAVATDTVRIPVGAWDPANAATAYSPSVITVEAGTTVTWTNNDGVVHTVTSGTSNGTTATPDGLFDSGSLELRDTFSVTFSEPGEYPYFCTPHPWMVGRVIVT